MLFPACKKIVGNPFLAAISYQFPSIKLMYMKAARGEPVIWPPAWMMRHAG